MKDNKDWRQRFQKMWWNTITKDHFIDPLVVENFIEQIISERDKEWEKWKVLAEAMDNAPVGHRVIIKHLLGEDEWTLTRRNK